MPRCLTKDLFIMKSKRLLRVRVWLGISFLIVSNLTQLADSNPKSGKAPKSEWLVETSWLNEHLKSQELILVDTRSQQEYSVGHIPGAVWLDLSDLPTKTSESGLQALGQELLRSLLFLGSPVPRRLSFTKSTREPGLHEHSGFLATQVIPTARYSTAGFQVGGRLAIPSARSWQRVRPGLSK